MAGRICSESTHFSFHGMLCLISQGVGFGGFCELSEHCIKRCPSIIIHEQSISVRASSRFAIVTCIVCIDFQVC